MRSPLVTIAGIVCVLCAIAALTAIAYGVQIGDVKLISFGAGVFVAMGLAATTSK